MEEILGSDRVADKTLSDFKARHGSGAFLCRYRSCPRGAEGFNTLELRRAHEESHVPRFKCAEEACGFFDWSFYTQAALKKHAAQYHGEERTASIPDFLGGTPHGSQQDRSLFTLNAHHSVKTSRSPKTTSSVQTSITNEDEQDLMVSSEHVAIQESLEMQQRISSSTPDPSVIDVENFLADLNLEDLSPDLKQ